MLLVYMCKFVSKDITLLLSKVNFDNTKELLDQFKKSIEFENEMLQYLNSPSNLHQAEPVHINFGIVDAFNSVIFLIISRQDEQLTKLITSLPKKIKLHSNTTHLVTRSEGIYLRSVDDVWDLAKGLMEDIRIVTNKLPLRRLIEAIDNALIEYSKYLSSIISSNQTKLINTRASRNEKIQMCIYVLNSCIKMIVLRREDIPNIPIPDSLNFPFETVVKKACSELVSQHKDQNYLLNTKYLGESIYDKLLKPKGQQGYEEQSRVIEELSKTLILYTTSNLQREIMSKKWSIEKASQKRLELTSFAANFKEILPVPLRTNLYHAIAPLDNLLLYLMTPIAEDPSLKPQSGQKESKGDLETLIDIYIYLNSDRVNSDRNVDEFLKCMMPREDFNRKEFKAGFLKKVPPKPSQI
jgi:hypothetical protein